MKTQTPIKVLAEQLREDHHGENQLGAALLIGAGVSVSAGIPGAADLINEIRNKYPVNVEHNRPSNYNEFMGALNANQRKSLINRYVKGAKINWAHIAMAQLIAHGFVTRVLTTNFDPLVSRACALIHEFPAIFDYANPPKKFDRTMLPEKTVFHLHGQHTGFVLRNTEEEVKAYADRIEDLLRDSTYGRPIIVVGYSGDCDHVFERLIQMDFDNSLYWVSYKDNPVSSSVQENLLDAKPATHLISGYDADGFFCELAKELKCFPPKLVGTPFSHLKEVLETLCEYTPHGQMESDPILKHTFQILDAAITTHENMAGAKTTSQALPPVSELWSMLMADREEEVAVLFEATHREIPDEYKEVATTAWYNWGVRLSDIADKTSEIGNRERLKLACSKYETALAINPNDHQVLNNYGIVRAQMALLGDEPELSLELACRKFEKAFEINPHATNILVNWGNTLMHLSELRDGAAALALLELACSKYEAAMAMESDSYEILYNWGGALIRGARIADAVDARSFLELACEKYELALALQPTSHQILNNWGVALERLAALTSAAEAQSLLLLACAKYHAALVVKPDKLESVLNWSTALLQLAVAESEVRERERLLREAAEVTLRAEEIKEGSGAYNLACISALQGEPDTAKAWLAKSQSHGELPVRAHLESDKDLDSLRTLPWFQELLASLT